ncbi:hypothetical protein BGP_1122 [Beggiatoa sp. PS]|nr:hypothetical protein BGP_1122 [Beggiatoa sp. PS]
MTYSASKIAEPVISSQTRNLKKSKFFTSSVNTKFLLQNGMCIKCVYANVINKTNFFNGKIFFAPDSSTKTGFLNLENFIIFIIYFTRRATFLTKLLIVPGHDFAYIVCHSF